MNKIKYSTQMLNMAALSVMLFCFPAYGDTSSSTNDFYVSVGNLCEYVGEIQTDSIGGKRFCSFMPALTLNYDYALVEDFSVSPQLGMTLPKSGRDENIKSMALYAIANAKYKTSYVNLISGLGLYFTRIWGPGGDELLNNGNSSDSFPLPKDPVYSRNFIVNLGISKDFPNNISAELYTYIFNALKKEDRAFSIGISASYHFGEIL